MRHRVGGDKKNGGREDTRKRDMKAGGQGPAGPTFEADNNTRRGETRKGNKCKIKAKGQGSRVTAFEA